MRCWRNHNIYTHLSSIYAYIDINRCGGSLIWQQINADETNAHIPNKIYIKWYSVLQHAENYFRQLSFSVFEQKLVLSYFSDGMTSILLYGHGFSPLFLFYILLRSSWQFWARFFACPLLFFVFFSGEINGMMKVLNCNKYHRILRNSYEICVPLSGMFIRNGIVKNSIK